MIHKIIAHSVYNNGSIHNSITQNRLASLLRLAFISLALLAISPAMAQTPAEWEKMKGDINLFMANDLGRNGYYKQKPIAELMGEMAGEIGPESIIAAGDVHHFNGVASVDDPLWTSNFENIYTHPELMMDWNPILGNHEYRGNTQACLDYKARSRRWMAEGRYYSRVFADKKAGVTLRVIFLDTTPLIDKYRKDSGVYPDAVKQDADRQIAWLDSTLAAAHETWVIVVGHHPIYAETSKSESERTDMQQRLLPVFKKHKNVDIYACGHIHNFQHITMPADRTQYVVNSSASLARKVKPIAGTVFCSPEAGFSVISATAKSLNLYMIDSKGKTLHTVSAAH